MPSSRPVQEWLAQSCGPNSRHGRAAEAIPHPASLTQGIRLVGVGPLASSPLDTASDRKADRSFGRIIGATSARANASRITASRHPQGSRRPQPPPQERGPARPHAGASAGGRAYGSRARRDLVTARNHPRAYGARARSPQLWYQRPMRTSCARDGNVLKPRRVPGRAPELPACMLPMARLMLRARHRHGTLAEAAVQRVERVHQAR